MKNVKQGQTPAAGTGDRRQPKATAIRIIPTVSLVSARAPKKFREARRNRTGTDECYWGQTRNGSTITGRTNANAATISWNLEEWRNAGDLASMEVDNQVQIQERSGEEGAEMIEKLKATDVVGVRVRAASRK